MHWADKIANKIVKSRKDKESYVCAAGISPSGPVHIGNFRDIATVFFVAKALKDLGKNVHIIFSWDDFDRLRKVPVNISESFNEHIGKPYVDIPDPFGCHTSYAKHFETIFENEMKKMSIKLDFKYQNSEYRNGRYADSIICALKKRKQIYDILAQFRSQKPSDEERNNYYPISIYCNQCKKDNTKVDFLSDDCNELDYSCSCGFSEKLDLTKGGNFKLPWKVDWPMRWKTEGVDFEPGGKDHATPGGSYYVSRIISEKIFQYPAPIFQGYEFVGITGSTSKMSGSSGMAITPGELLQFYQVEILLWNFARYAPTKAFNICLDEEILRQYDEFDRAYNAVQNKKASDQVRRNIELADIGRKLYTTPFRQLASFSTITKGNHIALEKIFERLNTPYLKEEFNERLEKAENWLKKCSPESVINLKEKPDIKYYNTLSDEEKNWIKSLNKSLSEKELNFEELTVLLYDIPKNNEIEDKENKIRQRRFFEIMYNLLISKDTGPRLSTFIQALGNEKIISLTNF